LCPVKPKRGERGEKKPNHESWSIPTDLREKKGGSKEKKKKASPRSQPPNREFARLILGKGKKKEKRSGEKPRAAPAVAENVFILTSDGGTAPNMAICSERMRDKPRSSPNYDLVYRGKGKKGKDDVDDEIGKFLRDRSLLWSKGKKREREKMPPTPALGGILNEMRFQRHRCDHTKGKKKGKKRGEEKKKKARVRQGHRQKRPVSRCLRVLFQP